MTNLTTVSVSEDIRHLKSYNARTIDFEDLFESEYLINNKRENSTLIMEVLELNKENQTCSTDLLHSFEWAVSGFIDFLILNGIEPSIEHVNPIISQRWFHSLEEENQNRVTIIMKIIVITSFFSHLKDLGFISCNPFEEVYENLNISLE
ncbi:hypothetical protein [Bacillus sp. MRMR6]|uniref:hypothetical protein n=1 Tax=Bacillus sp. MRMR6 TaxID=1928617 RepID=UPI000952E6B3|nr:hypothetical protein [Bacillus sp. MRMR6]OLS38585.1 hypothetical protein BTR25_14300 [Bacillus sp. MRMR6]